MSVDALLSRLQKVRRTGDGKWLACCPAHPDKHPSLGVRELPDGTVLLRCHARQCAVGDIVAAVGLELADLFPPSELPDGEHRRRPERRPWNPLDVLEGAAHEALIVAIAAADVARGKALSAANRERLIVASGRLQSAVEAARGRR